MNAVACNHSQMAHNQVDDAMVCVVCSARWVRDLRILEGAVKLTTFSHRKLNVHNGSWVERHVYLSNDSEKHPSCSICLLQAENPVHDVNVPAENVKASDLFPEGSLEKLGDWEISVRFKEHKETNV